MPDFASQSAGCPEEESPGKAVPGQLREERRHMLIGLPAILGPDLLFALRSMGHGDEIALVDGNYPAQEHARRLVRADGHCLLPVLEAILQVLPLDRSVPSAILRAAAGNDPSRADPIHRQIDACCQRLAPDFAPRPIDGAELYPRIRAAHTIVATSEIALFANVILRKGVICAPPPPGAGG
jgi:L-fucose mutarotase